MDKERVKNVVKLMTLAEKVELTNVNSDLRTSPLPRLKVPSLRLPKEFSAQASYKAPLAGALGHTFDISLVRAFAEKRSRQALTDGETFGGAVPLGVARDPFDRSACRAFPTTRLLRPRSPRVLRTDCVFRESAVTSWAWAEAEDLSVRALSTKYI